jgi:ribulose-5-phosphate 4-epimerase/fuculose-1-phosphate aldolase
VDNHFSVAVADASGEIRGDRFLINPHGWHWSEITASSLVLCDAEGAVLEGENSVEDTAFYIHSRIHLKVPSARVVLHTHQPYTTALTLLDGVQLEMCEQNALAYHDRIAYDEDYNGLALDSDEGDRMAARMGDKPILMLAGHGVVVTGPSVREAFNDLYYLERAAMFQVLARSTNKPLIRVSPEVIARTSKQMESERPRVAERHFAALKRMLIRLEPEFRD